MIAGITGNNIPSLEMYGKDGIIAKRMLRYGRYGEVTISEKTMKILEEAMPGKYGYKLLDDFKLYGESLKVFIVSENIRDS